MRRYHVTIITAEKVLCNPVRRRLGSISTTA